MRVLDSSALVKYLLGEDGWEQVEQAMREGAAIVDLALVEAANALARRVRAGKVDPATAAKALEGLAEGGGLRVIGFRELLKDALEISSREDLTMQDALFVAAALRLGAELVTADSRQAEVAARLGVPVRLL
ncbi:MAG: putative nucleic acid-binding protein, contains PIN domain [uncultured Acidilobus sp. OSP8]|nr:MAG: putative nucleic acid-binding protein, contains PIN domain [uncultured Acidilobus sp. OSP8]